MLQQLDDFLTRELGTFLLAGKSQPLVVHELLCHTEASTRQQRCLCALFAEALEAYRAQAWDSAIGQFSAPQQPELPGRWTGALLCRAMRAVQSQSAWDLVGWSGTHGEKIAAGLRDMRRAYGSWLTVCRRGTCMCRRSAVLLISLVMWLSMMAGLLFPSTAAADVCEAWVARMVSVQGSVQARRAGETRWQPVRLHDTYCPGDIIQVQEWSRAAIVLRNEAVLRLDQKTTITFAEPETERTLLLHLLTGAAHFFSRIPRTLKVITPFVNAAVEGTEFLAQVEPARTLLSIFDGRVAATNAAGSLTLTSGQAAVAQADQAPAWRVVVRPRDAVQWALYYPPMLDYRPADFAGDAAWQAMVRQSIQFYRDGDLPMAFASLAEAPEDALRDARFFTYRAALLLTVGRVDAARVDSESALQLDPRHSHTLALQAIIAVVHNDKDAALQLAQKAVKLEPSLRCGTRGARIRPAGTFRPSGSLASLQEAVQLRPEDALVRARLAELWLSVGELDGPCRQLESGDLTSQSGTYANRAGIYLLAQIKVREAQNAFTKAIELDQADPLPRLAWAWPRSTGRSARGPQGN